MVSKEKIIRKAKLELVRREFWEYCKLIMPKFYIEERIYLNELTHTMQNFLVCEDDILVINILSCHGKNLSAVAFKVMPK